MIIHCQAIYSMTSLLCIVKSDPITTLKLFMLKNRLGTWPFNCLGIELWCWQKTCDIDVAAMVKEWLEKGVANH